MTKSLEFILDNWETFDSYIHKDMDDEQIRETIKAVLLNNNNSIDDILLTINDYRVIMLFKTQGRH